MGVVVVGFHLFKQFVVEVCWKYDGIDFIVVALVIVRQEVIVRDIHELNIRSEQIAYEWVKAFDEATAPRTITSFNAPLSCFNHSYACNFDGLIVINVKP